MAELEKQLAEALRKELRRKRITSLPHKADLMRELGLSSIAEAEAWMLDTAKGFEDAAKDFLAAFDAQQAAPRCDCGKKLASECDKWEPGCDLGQSAEHARPGRFDGSKIAQATKTQQADDWQHLKQYGYAPGDYMSHCHACGDTPVMDKRATTCRPCAEAMHAQQAAPSEQPAQDGRAAFESDKGETNGRNDGLRSALHGRVSLGDRAYGALVDGLFASDDVMSLNAELGLTMDQLVRLVQATHAALASQPAARVALTDQERGELERLRALVNTPELHDFSRAVVLEAAHQRERWGSEHDAGKAPQDWFWLLGYLGGKALAAHASGNTDKALHHTISSAAALANWHAAISGTHTAMRPGIDPVARGITAPAAGQGGEHG